MTAAIIELNDHELRLAQDGQIRVRSPGCAIVLGNDIQVGKAAAEQAQLHPREFHNKFWYRLDQSPLRKPTRAARHNADLAFRHLEHVLHAAGTPKDAVFAIPGGFSKDQLALLLGICEALKLNAVALVDAAVASAASKAGPGIYHHVEVQLHRTVVTELAITESVECMKTHVIDNAGVDQLHNRFVAYVADQFLAQSRFDPLHQAGTEQLLYNEIAKWLELLRENREVKVHIDFRNSKFEARIARDDIIAIAEPTYADIRKLIPAGACILVGDRLAGMPGFEGIGHSPLTLPETAVFEGCAALGAQTSHTAAGLSLLTRLPACPQPEIFAPPSRGARSIALGSVATHILGGSTAFELSSTPIYLNKDGSISSAENAQTVARISRLETGISVFVENGAQLRINGVPQSNAVVSAGDEITFDGSAAAFLPINIVAHDA